MAHGGRYFLDVSGRRSPFLVDLPRLPIVNILPPGGINGPAYLHRHAETSVFKIGDVAEIHLTGRVGRYGPHRNRYRPANHVPPFPSPWPL